MNIRNHLKRAQRNSLTSLPCSRSHLVEHPHPTWRYADSIGWFRFDDQSGEFIFDAQGPSSLSTIGKPSERSKVMTGPHSFIFCLCDMSQATVESIPDWSSQAALANKYVGIGAHFYSYADPQTIRHMKSYSGRTPTSMGAGKWILETHPKEL